MSIRLKTKARESNSSVLEFNMVDIDGVTPVEPSYIATAVMTLKDLNSSNTINSCVSRNVKSYFGVGGLVQIVLSDTDNPCLYRNRQEELHLALLEVDYTMPNGRNMKVKQTVEFFVENLNFVTSL